MALRIVIVERDPFHRARLARWLVVTPTMELARVVDSVADAEKVPPDIPVDAVLAGTVEATRFASSLPIYDGAVGRLSQREREVLREISLGRSNADIAIRLGLKESTVKTHVSNILRKTGSRSRFVLQPAGHTLAGEA